MFTRGWTGVAQGSSHAGEREACSDPPLRFPRAWLFHFFLIFVSMRSALRVCRAYSTSEAFWLLRLPLDFRKRGCTATLPRDGCSLKDARGFK